MNTEIGHLIQLLDKRVRNCVTDFLQEYQANGVPDLAAVVRMESFDKVVTRKPKASRDRSTEVYLLGLKRKVNDI